MRYGIPIALWIPGYWFCISERGFGGLLALFLSPIVLAFALGVSAVLRSKLKIESNLHFVDFAGVLLTLLAAWFLVPAIR